MIFGSLLLLEKNPERHKILNFASNSTFKHHITSNCHIFQLKIWFKSRGLIMSYRSSCRNVFFERTNFYHTVFWIIYLNSQKNTCNEDFPNKVALWKRSSSQIYFNWVKFFKVLPSLKHLWMVVFALRLKVTIIDSKINVFQILNFNEVIN